MLPLPSFLETFTTVFSGTQPASRHSPWLLHAPALAPNPSANLLTSFFQFRRKHDPKWTSKSARYPYNTWKESEYADTHLQLMGDDKTLKKRKEGNNEEQWSESWINAKLGQLGEELLLWTKQAILFFLFQTGASNVQWILRPYRPCPAQKGERTPCVRYHVQE